MVDPRGKNLPYEFPPDISHLQTVAGDVVALVDRASVLFTAGTLGAESREIIMQALEEEPSLESRAQLAAYLTIVSPEGAILK